MDEVKGWLSQLQNSAGEVAAAFLSYLPNLLGALALLVVGWLLARLGRSASSAITGTASRTIGRILDSEGKTEMRLPTQTPKLVGDVIFWIIILFFVTAAAKTARFDLISNWLERLVSYVPTLVAGIIIVLVGYLVSALVRDIVAGAAWSAGIAQSKLIGTLAQAATFLTGFVIGLDQIGIDVSFLVTVIAIALGASLGGLSLAFGLGARTHADNLISARGLQTQYQRGQIVRIDNTEGEILEITPTAVVVAGIHGRATIPARLFAEHVSVLVTPEESDG